MRLSEGESRRFKHLYIGTEHVLLGLVHEVNGGAATILESLDVDRHAVRVKVERLVLVVPGLAFKFKLVFTPAAKRVMAYALEEAGLRGQPSVGTQHILIGLLRETEGVACQVLDNFGVMLDDARAGASRPIDDDHGIPPGMRGLFRRWFQF